MPPVSVVIAAHNEAAVIGRGLAALLADADPDEFAVVVVSNGSTDSTAEIARRVGVDLGREVEAVEIVEASKIAALRHANEILGSRSPATRLYVDADVVLATSVARDLASAVAVDEPRLGVVTATVDTSQSGWLVQRYYAVWENLARARTQGSGTGVLAVNVPGASRLQDWPDVLCDDEWVVRQFTTDERVVVDASVPQFAPHTLRALVRRRARVVNGNRQLDQRWPQPTGRAGAAGRAGELRDALRRREASVFGVVIYLGVTTSARILAAWRRRRGTANEWSRDASSRGSANAAKP